MVRTRALELKSQLSLEPLFGWQPAAAVLAGFVVVAKRADHPSIFLKLGAIWYVAFATWLLVDFLTNNRPTLLDSAIALLLAASAVLLARQATPRTAAGCEQRPAQPYVGQTLPMRTPGRKSAPGVRGGKTQKKNRTSLSPDIYVHDFDSLVIQRLRPSKGFYHAVTPTDIRRFASLIPDWEEASEGIKAVVLTPGGDYCYGRYNNAGIIKLDAWPREETSYVPSRKEWLIRKMGVAEADSEVGWFLRLDRNQVRCFLLLGTFLHELGHHVDRMTTRSKADASNGEPFAIAYEHGRQRELWEAFCREFGNPG